MTAVFKHSPVFNQIMKKTMIFLRKPVNTIFRGKQMAAKQIP